MSILGGSGYALAGSGAIREHGLTSRLTEDIGLFDSYEEQEGFPDAANRLINGLKEAGYDIEVYRRTDHFMSLAATKDGIRFFRCSKWQTGFNTDVRCIIEEAKR
ncbi:hypothetical protein [Rubneribacter badeniensis]|uniref:hypothetical protein n=1 Tax=Rubneribacter badeniensis TaxID=2070688 RepID=UPI0007A880B2|nr:hypothetical protein BN3658_01174 [Coriobacteriaceae bacterium CHKCI002]